VQSESGWYTPSKAKYHGGRPIAYKYRKGKMQRTLNRELKELETAGRDAVVTCEERRSGRGLFNAFTRGLDWMGGLKNALRPVLPLVGLGIQWWLAGCGGWGGRGG